MSLRGVACCWGLQVSGRDCYCSGGCASGVADQFAALFNQAIARAASPPITHTALKAIICSLFWYLGVVPQIQTRSSLQRTHSWLQPVIPHACVLVGHHTDAVQATGALQQNNTNHQQQKHQEHQKDHAPASHRQLNSLLTSSINQLCIERAVSEQGHGLWPCCAVCAAVVPA